MSDIVITVDRHGVKERILYVINWNPQGSNLALTHVSRDIQCLKNK